LKTDRQVYANYSTKHMQDHGVSVQKLRSNRSSVTPSFACILLKSRTSYSKTNIWTLINSVSATYV